MREKMAQALPVLATVFLILSGQVTAADPIPVDGQLGSDLLLPVVEACTNKSSYLFDLYTTRMIGVYDGELQGLKNYTDRLVYNKSTCTITLRGLRTLDGTTFTVNISVVINDKLVTKAIRYQIIIRDPATSHPFIPATKYTQDDPATSHPFIPATKYTQDDPATSYPFIPAAKHTEDAPNKTQSSNDGGRSFISFCLSLDSVVNAAFGLLLLILQRCCSKMDDGNMYISCLINSIITAVSQICSIGTMLSGNLSTLFLGVIPVILILDILGSRGYLNCCKDFLITCFSNRFPCCTCCSDDSSSKSKSIARNLWIGMVLLLQVLFAVVVGILYFRIGTESSWIGYLILSILFLLKLGVFIITYCCYKTRFHEVPTEDPKATSDDPEKETPV